MDGEKTQRETDKRDFNNEAAGLETGRQERFFVGRRAQAEFEKKKEGERRDSALGRLLQDPEYARLYQGAWDVLDSSQEALDRAILRNAEASARLTALVERMESNAATLANGEKVFRSKDGHVYTADGRKLSDEEADGIVIPDDAPGYEESREARSSLQRTLQRGQKLSGIQTDTLDDIRRRLSDEDNPPSKGDLEKMTKDLEEAKTKINDVDPVSGFNKAADTTPADEAPLALADLMPPSKLRP